MGYIGSFHVKGSPAMRQRWEPGRCAAASIPALTVAELATVAHPRCAVRRILGGRPEKIENLRGNAACAVHSWYGKADQNRR